MAGDWKGKERRKYHEIPEELIDHIAERAAERVLEKVYQNVGKSVVRKLAWTIGLAVIGFAVWLNGGKIS